MSEIGIKVVLVLAALVVGVASRWIPNFNADNPIEQAAESVIEKETGCEIDLSPYN